MCTPLQRQPREVSDRIIRPVEHAGSLANSNVLSLTGFGIRCDSVAVQPPIFLLATLATLINPFIRNRFDTLCCGTAQEAWQAQREPTTIPSTLVTSN
jgi:hypothetical protein